MSWIRECDECGLLSRGEGEGWRSDAYTGRVLCPRCVERAARAARQPRGEDEDD